MVTSTAIMIGGGVLVAVGGVLVCLPGSTGRRLVETKMFLHPIEVVPRRRHKRETRDLSDRADRAKDRWLFS